ncbi:hypothetical protein HK105_201747 [Polyrhizophydium stewartii]|uniref:Ankyrin repeat protein n=1 Tax=Polyrhizophydium stewartii TaxID=2732419 RepID=A0ABR4NH96_9FUNG
MVLARSGDLTALANRWIEPGVLRRLGPRTHAALWADAIAVDWQGDLRLLPAIPADSPCFAAIASRAMLARIAALAVADPRCLRRAAVRARWADVLASEDPAALAETAAEEGALWLLTDLADSSKIVLPSLRLVEAAARGGHLGVVRWLHDRSPGLRWPLDILALAAQSGSLELVIWLKEARFDGMPISVRAVSQAVEAGHVAIADWVLASQTFLCPPSSSVKVAEAGHLPMLKWLHARRPSLIDPSVFVIAARTGRLDILVWLHSVGIVADPEAAFNSALALGSLPMASWIHSALAVAIRPDAVLRAAKSRSPRLVRWLLDQPGVVVPDGSLERAAESGHLGVVKLLLNAGAVCTPLAVSKAAESGSVETIAHLISVAPTCCTSRAFRDAAANNNIEVLDFLLAECPNIARSSAMRTDMPLALEAAAGAGYVESIRWMIDNLTGIHWNFNRAYGVASQWHRKEVLALIQEISVRNGVSLSREGCAVM